MEKRTSAVARIFALLALAGAVVAVVVAVSGSVGGTSSSSHHQGSTHLATREEDKPTTKAATYRVKTGDTLTAISHHTGVPVSRILALNPETDPLSLIAGELLKLR
jgi:LysM repeat protein